MVSSTSARPRGPLVAVPAKMTSSILPPRSVLAPCSPITQASASTTFDLPDPLGPTTAVTPGSKAKVVGCANDLKPLRVRLLRYTPTSVRSAVALVYGTGTDAVGIFGQRAGNESQGMSAFTIDEVAIPRSIADDREGAFVGMMAVRNAVEIAGYGIPEV